MLFPLWRMFAFLWSWMQSTPSMQEGLGTSHQPEILPGGGGALLSHLSHLLQQPQKLPEQTAGFTTAHTDPMHVRTFRSKSIQHVLHAWSSLWDARDRNSHSHWWVFHDEHTKVLLQFYGGTLGQSLTWATDCYRSRTSLLVNTCMHALYKVYTKRRTSRCHVGLCQL